MVFGAQMLQNWTFFLPSWEWHGWLIISPTPTHPPLPTYHHLPRGVFVGHFTTISFLGYGICYNRVSQGVDIVKRQCHLLVFRKCNFLCLGGWSVPKISKCSLQDFRRENKSWHCSFTGETRRSSVAAVMPLRSVKHSIINIDINYKSEVLEVHCFWKPWQWLHVLIKIR